MFLAGPPTLRDSGPLYGTQLPSVETTFTRPNPVRDVTNCRGNTSVLSLRHTKQAIWTAVWFVFTTQGHELVSFYSQLQHLRGIVYWLVRDKMAKADEWHQGQSG